MSAYLTLQLEGGGPMGFGTGSYGYELVGYNAGGQFFSRSFTDSLAVGAYGNEVIIHNDSDQLNFILSPGETATFWLTEGYARFSILTAVPEPASWAMLIAGFGLVGAAARRRTAAVRA